MMAQDNSIIGEWIGHWSCNKYDPGSDTTSPVTGRSIVRIERFGDDFNVRIKEIDETAQPQLTKYINGITIKSATDSLIEISFPCGEWYVWTVRLVLKNNYIIMTAFTYDEERKHGGPECPVVTAWQYSGYSGAYRPFYEIKLYKEDNDW